MVQIAWTLSLLVIGLALKTSGHPYEGNNYEANGGNYDAGHPKEGSGSGSGSGSGGSGYPPGGNGYGGGPYYGYYGYYRPIPISMDEPLTELDQLFAALADIDSELMMVSEELSASQARLVLAKRFADELMMDTLVGLSGVENEQNNDLQQVNETLGALGRSLETADTMLAPLAALNNINANTLLAEAAKLIISMAADNDQLGELDRIATEAPMLQDRLMSDMNNVFRSLGMAVDSEQNRLNIAQRLIHARQCESGTVTLHRDDSRAEVLFQTNFQEDTPQVLYGIAGFQFDLHVGEHQPQPPPYGGYGPRGYGGYGSKYGGKYGSYGGPGNDYNYGSYGYSEPNAMGVYVTANPTPNGVSFQAVNLGFGDTDLLSVKVNYQACNIGPDPFNV